MRVTRDALDTLKATLDRQVHENKCGPDVALRMTIDDQGKVKFLLDMPMGGDQVVHHNGYMVLIIGEDCAQKLDGLVLGAKETPDGYKLTLTRSEPATA